MPNCGFFVSESHENVFKKLVKNRCKIFMIPSTQNVNEPANQTDCCSLKKKMLKIDFIVNLIFFLSFFVLDKISYRPGKKSRMKTFN